MPALLAAQEVSKIYQMGSNSVAALDNVSLEINEGEFVAIQGTSGSGKSTLLNMLGGLDHPTKGEVYFASRPLGPFTKKEMARYRHDLSELQSHSHDDRA
jgi:putative ABC transport system ATP-binding protein